MISDISKIEPVGADSIRPQDEEERDGRMISAPTRDKPRTPEMIGAEIRMYVDAGRRAGAIIGLEIGRRLVEAKAMLNHGEWLPWLEKETGFSNSSAARYMRFFNQCSAEQLGLFGPETNLPALANLSITSAFNLLALPDEERESFIEEHNIENLSTREVERLVKERTEELRAQKEAAEAVSRGEIEARKEAEYARKEAEEARIAAENDLSEAEEQLRKIKAELDEIEKRPQAVVYERDEEAIAKAANDAADAEREKHEKAEKELKEQIAALTGQVKTESGNREKLEKQLHEAEEKVAAAQKDGAEAEELRGQIEGLKKQLAMAAPEVAEFKAAFERVQREFSAMLETLDRIQDEDTKGKLRTACAAVLDGFMGRVKE